MKVEAIIGGCGHQYTVDELVRVHQRCQIRRETGQFTIAFDLKQQNSCFVVVDGMGNRLKTQRIE